VVKWERMKQELARVSVDGVDVPVVLNTDRARFEIAVGDERAVLNYDVQQHALSLIHTEVPEALGGKHLGDALARAALEYAREQQLTVKPYCPFVAAFISKHRGYADLVRPARL
jgi:uncharacterized protein